MSKIRIFSYLPNPRGWKAVIAGKLCNVEVEVIGDKPRNLPNWLWDYDARILEEEEKQSSPHRLEGKRGFTGDLFKTSEFLNQHPFGTVPAAFVGENKMGVFESNSIMRALSRKRSSTELYRPKDSAKSTRIHT